MTTGIASKRARRFLSQNGKCFHCNKPMWERRIENMKSASVRLGINLGTHGWNKKMRDLRCTAEHLVPLAQGGSSRFENIVAAHLSCNSERGIRPVEDYKSELQSRSQPTGGG